MTPIQEAIVRAATEDGVDPATALAYAARESNFDPHARSSKTIAGLFQMRGDLRQQTGVGDSDDPYAQTKGWTQLLKRNKAEMSYKLGRPVTDEEAYLGHHFGAGRAAAMMKMDPNTPVDQVFTPNEMAQNPHFGRAGTVGALNGSVLADMTSRRQKFGGDVPDLSSFGTPVQPTADRPDNGSDYQGNFDRNKKWSKPGTYRTELGDQEPVFQKWVKDNKVPFDVNRTGPDDYDMRGFWKGAQEGDPHASTAPNPNDGQIHYDDKWKTPYHKSFSSESQWAQPNAPTWNEKDQLIDPSNGSVVFDEKAPQSNASPSAPDLSSFGTLAEPSNGLDKINMTSNMPSPESKPDFSKYGTPVPENPMIVKNPVQLGIRG